MTHHRCSLIPVADRGLTIPIRPFLAHWASESLKVQASSSVNCERRSSTVARSFHRNGSLTARPSFSTAVVPKLSICTRLFREASSGNCGFPATDIRDTYSKARKTAISDTVSKCSSGASNAGVISDLLDSYWFRCCRYFIFIFSTKYLLLKPLCDNSTI